MSDRVPPTTPDLERVRQSRGLSWKVATVVAVAVLAAVAGLSALGGRTPPPAPDVAVVPSPARPTTATASAAPGPQLTLRPIGQPPPPPTPTPMPVIPAPPQTSISDIRLGDDAFALIARIDGRLYFDVLQESSPGSFSGIFRLPFPTSSERTYRFDFVQLWTDDERVRNYVEIGSWNAELGVLREGTNESGHVFSGMAQARSGARAVPRAIRRGYSIEVGAESRYSYGVIVVAVEFGPGRSAALLVDRDWPLRKDKDNLARLYRDFVGL